MNVFFSGVLCLCVCCALLFSACTSPSTQQPPAEEQAVTDPALQEINAAILRNPGNAENYVHRAQYHQQQGNHGDAITDMAEAMHRDSVNERYHHLLADIYMQSARSQYALGTMERAAQLHPESMATLLKLAEMQLIVKQYDKLGTNLRYILSREPQNTEALMLLGMMYLEQENLPRAMQSFQTVVELDSEHAEAWTMLGNLYDQQGDPRALQCFENAIAADPEYPQGWHSKAYYLQNRDRIAEAIDIYRHIHTIDETYRDAWLNRGILHLETDSVALAAACFDRLLALDSVSILGHYYAGITAQKAGDREAALQHLERARELNPSSPRIQEALEGLK